MRRLQQHGSRDPQLYVDYSRSYFNFAYDQEESLKNKLSSKEIKLLELFSNEIANTKRIEEVLIIKELLKFKSIPKEKIKIIVYDKYGILISNETIKSCLKNINFEFITENKDKQMIRVREKYNLNIISCIDSKIEIEKDLRTALENGDFVRFLNDMLIYSETIYDQYFDKNKYIQGFILYQKYSRKDVFRILNWDKNPVAQNVGGYIISSDKTNCPVFVIYNKDEGISETTKYHDKFVDIYKFDWMSKSRRTLNSPDIVDIRSYKNKMRIPLFIKKSNDEGKDFYYMGDMTPIDESIEQAILPDGKSGNVSVVKIRFHINQPVEDSIYKYITESNS
jgi:hypothetical protein